MNINTAQNLGQHFQMKKKHETLFSKKSTWASVLSVTSNLEPLGFLNQQEQMPSSYQLCPECKSILDASGVCTECLEEEYDELYGE